MDVVLVGMVYADSYTPYDCCERDCSRWCDPCENYAFLRPAQPSVNCGFIVGAEYLYWQARENNLDYVQTDIEMTGDPGGQFDGTLNYVKYNWDSGFRVWSGYQWGCDGWESSIVYTYLRTRGFDKTEADNLGPGEGIGAVLVNPIMEAEAELKLKYQTLDLLLSRPFCISQSLILKPHFGFRALWLDRHLMASYEDVEENYVTVILDSELVGYGLHGGIDGYINLCRLFNCGFISLRGLLGGTIVASNSNNRNIERSTSALEEINTKDKNNCIGITGLHLGVGISWENCFNCFYTHYQCRI